MEKGCQVYSNRPIKLLFQISQAQIWPIQYNNPNPTAPNPNLSGKTKTGQEKEEKSFEGNKAYPEKKGAPSLAASQGD